MSRPRLSSLAPGVILIGLLGVSLVFSACKPAKVSNPQAEPGDTARQFNGRLTWTGWQRWVQGQPRVLLVSAIPAETRTLIERQTLLFRTVIGETGAQIGGIASDQFAQLRGTFSANNASRSANSPIPVRERWDRYSNTVTRLQADTAATALRTLEAYVARDRQDLQPHINETGDIGNQARADLDWIESNIKPVIDTLKSSLAPTGPALNVEQARTEWRTFETKQLPRIAKAIADVTVAEAAVGPTGAYHLSGSGELVAVITVAGRELYFPATANTPGLGF